MAPPPLSSILETCIYVRSMQESLDFYTKIFNLKPVVPDFVPRIMPLHVGDQVLILFQLGMTAESSHPNADSGRPDDTIPGHGPSQGIIEQLMSQQNGEHATLKTHFCFGVDSAEQVLEWEEHLKGLGVKVAGVMKWPAEKGRSVYFEDPDGHIGEIATKQLWQ